MPFVEGKTAVSLTDGQLSWLARGGAKLSLISAKHLEFGGSLDFLSIMTMAAVFGTVLKEC